MTNSRLEPQEQDLTQLRGSPRPQAPRRRRRCARPAYCCGMAARGSRPRRARQSGNRPRAIRALAIERLQADRREIDPRRDLPALELGNDTIAADVRRQGGHATGPARLENVGPGLEPAPTNWQPTFVRCPHLGAPEPPAA